jgi:hypothetical protein
MGFYSVQHDERKNNQINFAGEHPEAMHSNESPAMTLNIGFMWCLATANVMFIVNHISRIS